MNQKIILGIQNIINKKPYYVVSSLFVISFILYKFVPPWQECDYYFEQPLKILEGIINPFCQKKVLLNIGSFSTLLAGVGFSIYWLIVGRIRNPHLVIMKARRERSKLKWKAGIITAIAIFGILFMVIGINVFLTEPYRINYSEHNEEIELSDGKKGNVRITFDALNGLMPFRGINTDVKVIFYEKINNTSMVEIEFPEAGVITSGDTGTLIVGKIIPLEYFESNSKSSTYSKKFYALYNNPGKYSATLKIKNNDENFDGQLESVVTIGSWYDDLSFTANYRSEGLAWMIFGISLITTATIFTKLVDLYYKYFELRRREFYE